MAGHEREFVRWVREAASRRTDWVSLGVGDDMAALAVGGAVLISSDMLLDGTHFDSREHAWEAIGRKAAGCGLSDCAAMAVNPVGVTVSVAWQRGVDIEGLRRLMAGIIERCGQFGCEVVGGDTTSWAHPLAIDVTVLAVPFAGVTTVRRSGAQAGDGVYVTGKLGGSLLGKHLDFVPRVREARAIAERLGPRLHAMIDVTDGLAIDLDRVAEASGVCAVLDESSVRAAASDAAHAAAGADGRDVHAHVLGDGEDFELLLTGEVAPADAEALSLLRVGEIVAGAGLRMRSADGALRMLAAEGYEHL